MQVNFKVYNKPLEENLPQKENQQGIDLLCEVVRRRIDENAANRAISALSMDYDYPVKDADIKKVRNYLK